MPKIVSRKTFGFRLQPLHKKREPHPVFFLSQRSSFWIASFSILAFVVGNMVGQHGWYLFWASVLGQERVVYTGTVSPIREVPDYEQWSRYGGNQFEHTYRQVPKNVLKPLPRYTETSAMQKGSVYSVSYMGTYTGHAEGSGSHPGVDIRVPVGTPVLAMANGVVEEVSSGGGFGNVIVLRHPNVPDPSNPNRTTTLYSSYAHLDSVLVKEGTVVNKGEKIALSGMTGFTSGPHLHFQIDTEEAPWHPYWPFNSSEQRGMSLADAVNSGLHKERGFAFTVSPMLYVQANYAAVANETVAEQPEPADPVDRLLSSVEQRRRNRMRDRDVTTVARHAAASSSSRSSSVVTQQSSSVVSVNAVVSTREEREAARKQRQQAVDRRVEDTSPVVDSKEVVSTNVHAGLEQSTPVAGVRIRHDGMYSGRGWEKLTVQLVNKDGNVVADPQFTEKLYMRTAYGNAEFRPSIIEPDDFVNGEITVHMLPRGRRTIVIQARPFAYTSRPMVHR